MTHLREVDEHPAWLDDDPEPTTAADDSLTQVPVDAIEISVPEAEDDPSEPSTSKPTAVLDPDDDAADAVAPVQQSMMATLIPEHIGECVECTDVKLGQIGGLQFLPNAPDGLRRSVARFGVLEPVILRRDPDSTTDGYRIVDGRRRCAAARDVPTLTIPARVYEVPDVVSNAMLLTLNCERAANYVAECRAIQKLKDDGLSESEIGQVTGIAIPTLKRRLRLHSLIVDLAEAFDAGTLAPNVAEQCAKLDPQQQEKLAAILNETGKLTARDVRAIKQVGAADAAHQLPSELFDTPGAEALAPPLPWYEQAQQQLSEVLALIPSDDPGLDRTRADVARVLKRLVAIAKSAATALVDDLRESDEADDDEDAPI
jgi:ParB/RepB/Spo0J family partition protein